MNREVNIKNKLFESIYEWKLIKKSVKHLLRRINFIEGPKKR